MWKVQLFELNYDGREEEAVANVLKSRWITMGENTKTFEMKFGEFNGCRHLPTAVSSATAALHMSLMALDIGHGDEVIISALTFIADANVVKMVGASPVLADVTSFSDWNISARTIAERVTPNTKAVIIVHYGGVPCEMDEIVALCNDRRIALIEDVAHAPGAEYKGIKCGNFGDLAAFSFFTNKNLSVGEGGMVIAKTEELNERIKYLRSHGMSTLTLDRHKGRAITYDVMHPGLNYRMDEMRAALGLVQLDKLSEANRERKYLSERYSSLLSGTRVEIPFQDLTSKLSAYHIYPILLPENINREILFNSLKEKGIQTSIHYPSIQSFTAYRDLKKYDTPVSETISQRELTLPLYPSMRTDQVDMVVENLIKALNEQ
ncbi:MAG TPA: DegT/DnrJ/EryC1/StrS family aminotransferase [Cyclobacteriaceae bacterium]|nr:DegT/DnrJ/EryC1/StrS family aminotransferase [Cyclobacteriaceae bacterium]